MARNPVCSKQRRPKSPPTPAMSEEKFLEVLDKMSRICGVSGEGSVPLSVREAEALDCLQLDQARNSVAAETSPPAESFSPPRKATKRKYRRRQNKERPPACSDSHGYLSPEGGPGKRTRHSSGTSALSSASFDSAIGDVYSMSVQTPRSDPEQDDQGQQQYLDNGHAQLENGHAQLENGHAQLENGHAQLENGHAQLENGHAQLDNGHALLTNDHALLDSGHTQLDNGHGHLNNGHRQLDNGHGQLDNMELGGGHREYEQPLLDQTNIPIEAVLRESGIITSDMLTAPPTPALPMSPPANNNLPPSSSSTPPLLRRQRKKYQAQMNASLAREERSRYSSSAPHHPGDVFREAYRRHEVEVVCVDLLKRYQHTVNIYPPINPAACLAGPLGPRLDPLLVATRLLTDSLSRLRVFLSGLDSMGWVTGRDKVTLYNTNICGLAILKASVGLDLAGCPVAYPLPYGEYLGETEALHLITAHDLYNQLRSLISSVQSLGIREFPVMLLVMIVAFFWPGDSVEMAGPQHGPQYPSQVPLLQPDRIARIRQYYSNKLQTYLCMRYGSTMSYSVLNNIYMTLGKVREFSWRLREFLAEVTGQGLQTQYESVCENIGLMAYLMQCEPNIDM